MTEETEDRSEKRASSAATPEEVPTLDPDAPIPGADEEPEDEEHSESGSAWDFVESFYAAQTAKKPVSQFPRLFKSALSIVWAANPKAFIISTILQLLTASALGVQLLAGRDALQTLFTPTGSMEDNFRRILPSLLTIGIVGIAQRIASSVQQYQDQVLSLATTNEALRRLLDVTTAVELEAYEDSEFFDRLQRARAESGFRTWRLISGSIGFIGSLLGIIGVSGALIAIKPILLPLILAAYIPTLILQRRKTKDLYELHHEMTASERERSYLTQVLTGKEEAKEVRAFGLAPALYQRYQRLYHEYEKKQLAHQAKSIRRDSLGALITTTLTGGVLLLVIVMVLRNQVSYAEAGSALMALQLIRGRISMIMLNATGLYETSVFLEDTTKFLELKEDIEGKRPKGAAPRRFERLVVENISFSYPGSKKKALDAVDLEINAGEVVALVGENGSGKTTLAKLLARLYRPTEGRILWDGADIAEMDPDELRRSIAVIFQDFIKYKLPARENIGVGQIEKFEDLDAIMAAAQQAGAHSFLKKMKNGYETVLSKEFKGGRDLSVGQWQKVALARAFFRDAPFIILDEPTAALDPRAEQNLFDGIRSLTAGRSVLLISHRFSSVRSADRTYVLQEGKVIENGSHKELMSLGGVYAELFTLQASQYLDIPTDASELSTPGESSG